MTCPGKCCPTGDNTCKKRLDNTGYAITMDDEIMLIFGGITWRNKTYTSTSKNTYYIFDDCESYASVTGESKEKPDSLKSCGEELLNDLWRYSKRTGQWIPIKITYNKDTQTKVQAPSPRYGHTGSYVELDDLDSLLDANSQLNLRRKYLYIYGGFSFDCVTACYDTWRYEIPFAPYAYYPTSKSQNVNPGNFWSLQANDITSSPGPRFRHSMISF